MLLLIVQYVLTNTNIYSVLLQKYHVIGYFVCKKSSVSVTFFFNVLFNTQNYIFSCMVDIMFKEIDGSMDNILNAELSPVQMDNVGVCLMLAGSADITLDGNYYHIESKSLVMYFPNSFLHILGYSPDMRAVLLGGDVEDVMQVLDKVTDTDNVLLIRSNPTIAVTDAELESLMLYIRLYMENSKRMSSDDVRKNRRLFHVCRIQNNSLYNCFALEVIKIFAGRTLQNKDIPDRKDEIFGKFITMMCANYREQHEVAYYAESQYLSCRYFSSIVKMTSGKTPMQWITMMLLAEAKNLLLHSSLLIKEISDRLNFPNQSYFGKWFKKQTGVSPQDFKSAI